MLPYALAIIIGLSSFVLFLTAFLMPKIHRQDDFLWSGVGLFYALVLWFCATKIHGALLLGQLVAVALLSSYTWQIITLRQIVANPEVHSIEEMFSVTEFLGKFLNFSAKSDAPETSISEAISASEDTKEHKNQEEVATVAVSATVKEVSSEITETADTDDSLTSTPTPQEEKPEATSSEITETADTDDSLTSTPTPQEKKPEATSSEITETDDSFATIEAKIDEIFQDKEPTEMVETSSEMDDSLTTSDIKLDESLDKELTTESPTAIISPTTETEDSFKDLEITTDDSSPLESESSNWDDDVINWNEESSETPKDNIPNSSFNWKNPNDAEKQ